MANVLGYYKLYHETAISNPDLTQLTGVGSYCYGRQEAPDPDHFRSTL